MLLIVRFARSRLVDVKIDPKKLLISESPKVPPCPNKPVSKPSATISGLRNSPQLLPARAICMVAEPRTP